MDYQELKQIEDDLWEAADQLRANSKLTASEYSMPVLGLIFLRHATTRFNDLLPEVEKAVPARAKGALREDRLKLGFQGKAACVHNTPGLGASALYLCFTLRPAIFNSATRR